MNSFFNIGGLNWNCQLGSLDKVLVVAYTDPMKGWIYIMSNASFSDGRIKIGMSSKDPVERKSELESSGVPEPFVIEYKAMVDDYQRSNSKYTGIWIIIDLTRKENFLLALFLTQ